MNGLDIWVIGHSMSLKNIVTLKSRLGITRSANVCAICTSLKFTNPALSFVADSVSVIYIHFGKSTQGEVVRYCRSRSFKVIKIGSSWKPMCDFLLVFHCKYMPVLHCFRDIAFFSRPILAWSPHKEVLLGHRVWKWWKLHDSMFI